MQNIYRIIVLLLIIFSFFALNILSVQIIFKDNVSKIDTKTINGKNYYLLDNLKDYNLFKCKINYDDMSIELSNKGKKINFNINGNFIRIGKKIYYFSEIVYKNNAINEDALNFILSEFYGNKFDKIKKELYLETKMTKNKETKIDKEDSLESTSDKSKYSKIGKLIDVNYSYSKDSNNNFIEYIFDKNIKADFQIISNNEFNLIFYGSDDTNIDLVNIKKKFKIINKVTKEYKNNSLIVNYKLNNKAYNFSFDEENNKKKVNIWLKTTNIVDAGLTKNHRNIIVVLDPGHGGKDSGAVGQNGLLEKDVVLSVALKLKKYLELSSDKIKVFLTRDGDYFLSLKERSDIANKLNADVFISIHCNAALDNSANGTEVFFLSQSRTSDERAVEALENAAINFEEDKSYYLSLNSASKVLWDFAQDEYLKQSQYLAKVILNKLCAALDNENRGLKQAGFYVLRGAFMPSILIETGFISNSDDADELASSKYQKKIAKSIAEGLVFYLNKYQD